jgi:hypothetical protein
VRPLPNTYTVTHHSSRIHNISGKVHFAKPNRLVMSALNGGIITFERRAGVRNALDIAIMQSGATITNSRFCKGSAHKGWRWDRKDIHESLSQTGSPTI